MATEKSWITKHHAQMSVRREAALREQAEAAAEAIMRQALGVECTEPQGCDRLDFHEISVTGIKEALTTAYLQGRRSARGGQR